MKKRTAGRAAGRQPMVDKQREYSRLIRRGVSNSEACRRLGIDRKTGHWWKNGGQVTRNGVTRIVEPVINRCPESPASPRYLSQDERVVIADGVRAGRSARSLASELGRSPSTVAREIRRNSDALTGEYRPHAAHQQMLARRPRPKERRLATEHDLRGLVQEYLDKHWSPEQIVRQLRVEHDVAIAVETIYQALYSPTQVLQRDPRVTLRTKRPYRRPRRRGDARRSRFIAPVRLITERPVEADDRTVAGHWEGDLIVGAYNRSAIGTLVERTTRYTLLVHLEGPSRAEVTALFETPQTCSSKFPTSGGRNGRGSVTQRGVPVMLRLPSTAAITETPTHDDTGGRHERARVAQAGLDDHRDRQPSG